MEEKKLAKATTVTKRAERTSARRDIHCLDPTNINHAVFTLSRYLGVQDKKFSILKCALRILYSVYTYTCYINITINYKYRHEYMKLTYAHNSYIH